MRVGPVRRVLKHALEPHDVRVVEPGQDVHLTPQRVHVGRVPQAGKGDGLDGGRPGPVFGGRRARRPKGAPPQDAAQGVDVAHVGGGAGAQDAGGQAADKGRLDRGVEGWRLGQSRARATPRWHQRASRPRTRGRARSGAEEQAPMGAGTRAAAGAARGGAGAP